MNRLLTGMAIAVLTFLTACDEDQNGLLYRHDPVPVVDSTGATAGTALTGADDDSQEDTTSNTVVDAPSTEEMADSWGITTSDGIDGRVDLVSSGGSLRGGNAMITDVSYDESTGELRFTFGADWDHGTNHYRGTVSADGNSVSGTWTTDPSNPNQIASSGTFTLRRQGSNS